MSDESENKLEDGLINLDPKRFFDSKNYNTLIVHVDGHTKKENATSELVISLIDKEHTPEEKEEILQLIKAQNAQNVLIESISTVENPDKKAVLIAACWECGLDFYNHFLFFVDLAIHDNYRVAMEAYTVIENMEGEIFREDLEKGKTIISDKIKNSPDTLPLLNDILHVIMNRLQSQAT